MTTDNKNTLNSLIREHHLLTKYYEELEKEYDEEFLNTEITRLENKIRRLGGDK